MPGLFLVDDHPLELPVSCTPPNRHWRSCISSFKLETKISKEKSIRTFQLNVETGFIDRVKPQASFEANWDTLCDQLRRLSVGKPLRFDLYMKYCSPSSDLSRFVDLSDSEEETDIESYSESSSDPEDGGSSIAERSRRGDIVRSARSS
ncbi:unnamed protein product [Cyclocybe aegerita]|uniref:Uncharacterized protein n=1 Tax=Cyclocybe aegerita TaxID=1973307 RepID=A0A8S0WG28_CYCAE|nr:unnamed protein product [Cyclocybe aegerita]